MMKCHNMAMYFQKIRILSLNFSRQLTTKPITPVKRYNSLLKEGILKPDRCQFLAILKLQELYNELEKYSPLQSTVSSMDSQENKG